MLHDRLCETEVRSRGDGGLVPDLSRKAGGGVKLKRYILLYMREGVKDTRN